MHKELFERGYEIMKRGEAIMDAMIDEMRVLRAAHAELVSVYGPSQTWDVGDGTRMATADLVQKVADKDCADAAAAIKARDAEINRLTQELTDTQAAAASLAGEAWNIHDAIAKARNDALEEAEKVADDYERNGELRQEYACETADEIAARIRNLRSNTSPSNKRSE